MKPTLWRDSYGEYSLLAVFTGAAVALGIFLFAFLTVVFVGTFYHDRARCASFERNTGRDTKFVRYTIVSWDCLTRSSNGKYIPISQLRDDDA